MKLLDIGIDYGDLSALILTIVSAASFALADSEAELMNRVNAALRSNPRLNGAKAYAQTP